MLTPFTTHFELLPTRVLFLSSVLKQLWYIVCWLWKLLYDFWCTNFPFFPRCCSVAVDMSAWECPCAVAGRVARLCYVQSHESQGAQCAQKVATVSSSSRQAVWRNVWSGPRVRGGFLVLSFVLALQRGLAFCIFCIGELDFLRYPWKTEIVNNDSRVGEFGR